MGGATGGSGGEEKSEGKEKSGEATGGALGEVGRASVVRGTNGDPGERTRAQLAVGLWPKTEGINLSDGKGAPELSDDGGALQWCDGRGVPKLNGGAVALG